MLFFLEYLFKIFFPTPDKGVQVDFDSDGDDEMLIYHYATGVTEKQSKFTGRHLGRVRKFTEIQFNS